MLDNLKALWAGWADAPLSVHGMNQAKALGSSLKDTKIDAIFASDLLRARWTSEQVELNQSDPKPPLTISDLLREQHFGIAEGQPFGSEKGGFSRQPGRSFKFKEGESLDDVRQRANIAIQQFVEPVLREGHGLPPSAKHIVIVAHGIFNSEFIGALLARRSAISPTIWSYKGMTNTGWTRLQVGYEDESAQDSTTLMETHPTGPLPPSSTPSDPPPLLHLPDQTLPPLVVRIIATDVTTHLNGLTRQKGGVGSSGFDEKQKDIRAFFGGGSNAA